MFEEFRKEGREKRRRAYAESLYQVTELEGRLWLTYGGQPVIPQDMIRGDILDAVRELREQYIKRTWTEV